MHRIYLDNNATTPVLPEVFEAMRLYFGEQFGNASSIHHHGQQTRAAVEDARESVAALLGCRASEIVFTSHESDEAGNNMVEVIKAQLDRARDDRRVKAVILKVDSPGGEVLASDEIYKAIRDFETDEPTDHGKQGRKGKPVICSMASLAASGGYYISSGCRWITANELTLTGSIGVIMHGWNYRGLMDKVGLAPMTYKSGKFKDMLSGERATNEIPPEEHAMVQGLIDDTFEKFKDVVRDGRAAAHD